MSVTDALRTIAPVQGFRERAHPDALFRASMLGYCPRKQLLSAKGVDLKLSDWTLRKYSMHGGAHDQVQNWLDACLSPHYDVALEHKIYDPLTRCGGHIDAVVVDDTLTYVVEIKTYQFLPPQGPKEDSYWQHQISFYYATVTAQQDLSIVQPIVLIVTMDGSIRVVEPKITDGYKTILTDLNGAWDLDILPSYLDCRSDDCKKCNLQTVCTEPIDTVTEFAEEVTRRAIQE